MKIKWVGKVELEMTVDENTEPNLLPFDEIAKQFDTLPDIIREVIASEVWDEEYGTIRVSTIEQSIEKIIGTGHSESMWKRGGVK